MAATFFFEVEGWHAVPNLLIMGRTREKMAYILRKIVPPRQWAAYYYSTDSALKLVSFYALRPFLVARNWLQARTSRGNGPRQVPDSSKRAGNG